MTLFLDWLRACGEKMISRKVLFILHFSTSLCLFSLYTSLINRLALFLQTAFPSFLLTATANITPALSAPALSLKFALILLSDEYVVWPPVKIFSKFFLLLIFSEAESPYFFKFYYSSLTDNFFLPFARLLAKTLLPFLVFILSLKPCVFFLFLLLG